MTAFLSGGVLATFVPPDAPSQAVAPRAKLKPQDDVGLGFHELMSWLKAAA